MLAAFARLRQRVGRFRRDEDGVIMTEFLILLPLLLWVLLGLFVYWDAYRNINRAQKATYAVADLVSRQGDINRAFVGGMRNIVQMMMVDAAGVRLRISSVQWREQTQDYLVYFSESPGNAMTPLRNGSLGAIRDHVPVMADLDSVVIVESEIDYTPALNFGIPPATFRNIFVLKPRYFRRVCLAEVTCPENP